MQHRYREAPRLGNPLHDVVYVCDRCKDTIVHPRYPILATQADRAQECERLSAVMHYTTNCIPPRD